MFYVVLIPLALFLVAQVYRWGVMVGEMRERDRAIAAAKEAADRDPFPEPEKDVADEDDDVDLCLRVGMPVVCVLSETSHTHGTILGFTMGVEPGSMLAIVDVGAMHPMPIDVDMVEPRGPARGPGPGYRESADPNKQWN